MISITTLLFSHYKLIISLVSIIPLIIGIYGLIKFSWTKIITSIVILILLIGFFCFLTTKESSSKQATELVNKCGEAIDKCDQAINFYKGEKSDREAELKKIDDELKTLYNQRDITIEQKEKIKKLLEQVGVEITDIKKQQKENETNINVLKAQLKQKEEKEQEIKQEITKKEEEAKLASTDDKIRLRAQIEKLQDEEIELINQITKIKTEIKKLENKQEYYQSMLSRAESLRNELDKQFKELSQGEKSLFKLITSAEDRKKNKLEEIKQIDTKITELEIERKIYKQLKKTYEEMANRMETYEQEHKASAGNIVKWGFKAFDRVSDLFPAKMGVSIIGKTLSFTRKFSQTMTKTAVVFHEGHRIWNIINDCIQESKEQPLIISKEMLAIHKARIDGDIAKIDTDIEKYKKDKQNAQTYTNTEEHSTEYNKSRTTVNEIIKKERSLVNEYDKIINELKDKKDEVDNIPELEKKYDKLEQKIYDKQEEINNVKEELKSKSPNYNRAQQKFIQKRKPKITEMVLITDSKNINSKK